MMNDINLPSIKIEEKAGNRAVFVVEPFFPGYGTTVGNALRRILLGSLPGVAVVAAKISGIDHEFSPIPGVKEDAVQVILNLKQLRFKLHEMGPVSVKLHATKAGAITGADLQIPSSAELVNPEVEIATLADKATLDIDITVTSGRGYLPSEKMDDESFSIGTIAIDAAFSPVQKVAFKVEPTRVGEMVNYDKLTIDILTDGTMAPDEAIKQSAQILSNQLGTFGATPSDVEVPVTEQEAVTGDVRDFNVDEINLSIRTTNALINNGAKKISDILELGPDKLQGLKGLGAKALDEIMSKLDELGLHFDASSNSEE
ncbi:TPA: DNA-directed RNA polymerase subunit alpha [Patescibacteria group bacterium]|uniref:DNA-directed RNA polymerase subunit alpha n=2 Tax=Bacteria division Kazan-3B-28 TaxID=1798534 RepID=A0A0G1X7D3_UNCK3|nr:MAG: DNA-directed RNA polymerase, alpha subunit, DNA-directed RNA polymerase subunit alpha [candidate division Kazan bacterium GW2011_GWA1_50_15]KKW25424.1 MAG: DNA-directed RNA polymerase subunit alpha [candidate division Kazan bacterium GW2011_GWC1_52_13]KKW26730.1 MAG: DNA-directed RNA polymerase subunit alpha [candidate division Kazan bacterium GW2011_GWB1_52_7]HAV65728.1 DNA-directed RNA polymerase subunit alpha [Patescibacteria group bacterium]HCL47590.1 DNA-directed RNA polymerase sub